MSVEEDPDRIEKQTLIRAPRSRVWRALTDPAEFGRWFRVDLRGPFTPGAHLTGKITYEGYEHLDFAITVDRVEPERLFSWRWHPHAIDPARDYGDEPTTLVEFALEDAPGGTLLRVTESGFAGIPLERRFAAYRGNTGGWTEQLQNIDRHVRAAA